LLGFYFIINVYTHPRGEVIKKMKDIGEDLEEFANYILEELDQSQGEVSNWDEIIRKWKLIEKKKDQLARKKLK
jgi:hypothetical protein